jgi:mannose-6-phosphate isomerase-like protein (cupin superfamily)
MMAGVQMSETEMAKYVARYDEMKSSDKAYVDTLLPDHEREIFNVIGPGITENPGDPNLEPALPAVEGFHLGFIRSQPGKRGALHAHDTVEVFIPMKGKWIIIWGDEGEHQLPLNTFDVITVPAGVFRCFKNVGDEEGLMIGMVSSTSEKPAGRVVWPEQVLRQVRAIGGQLGITVNDEGDLVRIES